MNPKTAREAVRLAKVEDKTGVVIAPPLAFIDVIRKTVRHAKIAAQNAAGEEKGPWTGEVSPAMLASLGVRYVILGHSERRMKLHETDADIAKKIVAALDVGLKVILCVGEPLSVRKKGTIAAKRFVKDQLSVDLKGIKNFKFQISNLVIAYEPVWAISTSGGGKETPEDAAAMAKNIREFVHFKLRISHFKLLYGGSVSGMNARGFLARKEFDGVLVGSASLKPKEFRKILRAGNR